MPLHSFPVHLFDMGLELFWPRLKALEKFASGKYLAVVNQSYWQELLINAELNFRNAITTFILYSFPDMRGLIDYVSLLLKYITCKDGSIWIDELTEAID
jgi:hypothetical protein